MERKQIQRQEQGGVDEGSGRVRACTQIGAEERSGRQQARKGGFKHMCMWRSACAGREGGGSAGGARFILPYD